MRKSLLPLAAAICFCSLSAFAAAQTPAAKAAAPTKPAAAHCRDAKGKFESCAKQAPAQPKHCRDAKGKFVACPK